MFMQSFTNTTLVDQQLRQERAFSRLALIAFSSVLFILSCFITLSLRYFGYFHDFSFFGLYATLVIVLVLMTTGRVAIYSLLAWLFDLDALQQHYSFHWLLTNFILVLGLLPLSILISFGPRSLIGGEVWLGLGAILIFYFIRVLRLGSICAFQFRIPLHYNFIYICALEILPILLAMTLVSRQFAG